MQNLKCYFSQLNQTFVFIHLKYSKKKSQFHVQSLNGMKYFVPLVSPINKIMTLPEGIILEIQREEIVNFQSVKEKVLNQKFTEQYPIFHPYGDFHPLAINGEQIFFNQTKRILYTDKDYPLSVTYDCESRTHSFCVLEHNLQEIRKSFKEIHFDKMIETLEMNKESFEEKIFSSNPYINLNTIFTENNQEEPAKKVVVVESPLSQNQPNLKNFFVYLLIENTSTNTQKLYIYSVQFKLNIDSNKKFFICQSVKKVNQLDNINDIWGVKYFDDQQDIFQFKNYFLKNLASIEKNSFEDPKDELISLTHSKLENLFKQDVKEKSIQNFFQQKSRFNCLVVQNQNKNLILLAEQTYLFEIRNFQNVPQEMDIDQFLQSYKVKEVYRNKIVFQNSQQNIVEENIPRFNEKLFDIIFQITKEIFDRQTFWTLIANLFKNNKKIYKQKQITSFPFLVDSEYEMICSFFCHAIIFNNFKKNGKNDILQIFQKNCGRKQQLMNCNTEIIFPENDQDFFNLVLQKKQCDEDYLELIELVGVSDTSKQNDKQFQDNQTKQNFPHMTINLKDFDNKKLELFQILHLLNEDFRLCKNMKTQHKILTNFLFAYAMFLNDENSQLYVEYYLKICPEVVLDFKSSDILTDLHKICHDDKSYYNSQQTNINNNILSQNVFDIHKFLKNFFESKTQTEEDQQITQKVLIFRNMYNIVKLVSIIQKKKFKLIRNYQDNPYQSNQEQNKLSLMLLDKKILDQIDIDQFVDYKKKELMIRQSQKKDFSFKLFDRIFQFFIKNKIDLEYIETQSEFIEYIYKSLIRLTRKRISFFLKNPLLPSHAYKLLGREDIFLNKRIVPTRNEIEKLGYYTVVSKNFSQLREKSGSILFGREDSILQNKSQRLIEQSMNYTPISKKDPQREFLNNNKYEKNQFYDQLDLCRNLHHSKYDILFREIHSIFDSQSQIYLPQKQANEIFDQSITPDEKQLKLQELIMKPVSQRLSLFVGKGALDFNTEQTSLTEVLNIPGISLNGKIKEKQMIVKCKFNLEDENDLSQINWPHFHNGVALALKISRKSLEEMDRESLRTWIDYQGNQYSRYDHAGLLFGLGLQGHFDCFTIADIYFNLRACNDARIVATILGLATSKKTKKNVNMDDTILKAFNLNLEFNYSQNTDVQINKIIQSAAMLGIGIYLKGMARKQNSEIMLSQIEAIPINENNHSRECYSLSAGFALGLINLSKGSEIPIIRGVNINERLFRYIDGQNIGDSEDYEMQKIYNKYKACNVKEMDDINTQITGPSALIALTLIHLKKNNDLIIDRLALPQTINELNKCNTKQIMLRVIARNLIGWDRMQISKQFIESQIPKNILFLHQSTIQQIEEKYFMNYNYQELDYFNLSLAYHSILIGTYTSLSLKYAGTQNQQLKQMMIDHIKSLSNIEILTNIFCHNEQAKLKLDHYSLFNFLSTMALSLGILMAGSCDTESLKVLKSIKIMLNKAKNLKGEYGFNMAINMAIGFVFLGNGAYTFGNNDNQLVYLLLSIYPIYPEYFNDNRYHLQAFRHFYVLAIEENLFQLIDIDTKQPLKLRVELQSLNQQGKRIKEIKVTPLFLKSTNLWEKMKLLDDDFHQLDFQFMDGQKPRCLFVKRKTKYEVQMKQIQYYLQNPSKSLQQPDINKLLKSKYLKDFFIKINQKISQESKLQQSILMKYYLSALFHILKKDKSNYVKIFFKYFLNEYNMHEQFDNQNLNQKKDFVNNSILIESFSNIINKKSEQFFKKIK